MHHQSGQLAVDPALGRLESSREESHGMGETLPSETVEASLPVLNHSAVVPKAGKLVDVFPEGVAGSLITVREDPKVD